MSGSCTHIVPHLPFNKTIEMEFGRPLEINGRLFVSGLDIRIYLSQTINGHDHLMSAPFKINLSPCFGTWPDLNAIGVKSAIRFISPTNLTIAAFLLEKTDYMIQQEEPRGIHFEWLKISYMAPQNDLYGCIQKNQWISHRVLLACDWYCWNMINYLIQCLTYERWVVSINKWFSDCLGH